MPDLAIEAGTGTLDAALAPDAHNRPRVRIGTDLVLSFLRIGQVNAYIFLHAGAGVDKETSLSGYLQETARGLYRAQRRGSAFRPVELADFFKLSRGQAGKLLVDENFNLQAAIQFRLMMIFTLAHEYAHFALGHHTRHVAPDSPEMLADEIEADALARRLVSAISADVAIGGTLPMLFYLSYLYESGRPPQQVRDLCRRAIDNTAHEVKAILGRMQDPTVAADMQKFGIDRGAFEQAQAQLEQYREACNAYAG
jgi:hypothetical protein